MSLQRYPLLTGIGGALIIFALLALLSILISVSTVNPTFAQTSTVTAEAVGQANLRAATDTTAEKLGEIFTGTRYPVIGRSALYPWILLADPTTNQPIGWVFLDLMTLQGNLNSVPVSETTVTAGAVVGAATPTSTLMPFTAGSGEITATPEGVSTQPSPNLTGVTGTVSGEINLRYGPGVDYPRIGVARQGEVMSILSWHTQLPWVQIRYEDSPTGTAWIAIDLLEIQGDLYTLPAISQTTFNLPTLTPTPASFDSLPVLGATPVDISPEFRALGGELWQMMLDANFDPATSRTGSFFLMDLQTGESIGIEGDTAFSGISVNKIPIVVGLYNWLHSTPTDAEAFTIANSMICSENISTNSVLSIVGEGNPYTGANRISDFLQSIGLDQTFIYTPFANDPFITPQAPRSRTTSADQVTANPDPYNQMTVNDIGGLLNTVYQCAYGEEESNPLLDTGNFTQNECRQILNVMSGNRIGNFIEAGVPLDVRVAHKHGWVNETHGDAGVVFTPGGDYVFVVSLYNPVWLYFEESSDLIAEMSRVIYNYFNPDAPMIEHRYEDVPATCNLLGNPFVSDLADPSFQDYYFGN